MALQLFKIADVTVASPATSIEFTSIPSGYTDIFVVTSNRATSSVQMEGFYIGLNGSTANFTGRYLQAEPASVSSGTLARYIGVIPAATATTSVFSSANIYIPNYTSSNNKSFSVDCVAEDNATRSFLNLSAGLWSVTSAVTSITLTTGSGSFATNSTATLYGVL
jgi:hypothetical protein